VFNIVSSFYPSVYYVFLCIPFPRNAYLTTVTVLGLATLLLSTLEVFQDAKWRSTRAGCFLALGLFGVFPWGHVLLAYTHIESVNRAMMLDLLMAVAYISAAAVYALRVPEKWFPGRFDLVLHSHQIFHIFVVVGAYLHYLGTLELVKWRDASGGCALELTESALVQQAVDRGDRMLGVDGLMGTFQERLQSLWLGHQSSTAFREAVLADGIDLGVSRRCPWLRPL
jgi:hypothetical protein